MSSHITSWQAAAGARGVSHTGGGSPSIVSEACDPHELKLKFIGAEWKGNCTQVQYNPSAIPASVNTASIAIPPWALVVSTGTPSISLMTLRVLTSRRYNMESRPSIQHCHQHHYHNKSSHQHRKNHQNGKSHLSLCLCYLHGNL